VSETAAKALLGLYGVDTPPGELVGDVEAACAAAARIGYPVVCKADGLAHKSDVGGVEVGLGDEPSLRRAFARVVTAAGAEAVRGIRVEAMEPHTGIEVIVGGRNTPAAGPLVVVGAGGVLAELIGDVAALVWPFSEADVADALAELRLGRLLGGVRGAPPSDVEALTRAATAVGQLLADLPEVVEVDINPVLVRDRGRGCIALDGLVVLAQDTPIEEKV
jgi:acetyltransferase